MNKIWLILKSEFTRRVTSKWFLVITLLAPLALVALMTLPSIIAVMAADSSEQEVAVIDETGVLLDRLQHEGPEQINFVAVEAPVDSVRASVLRGDYDGYLMLPQGLMQRESDAEAVFYSGSDGGVASSSRLASTVRDAVRQERLEVEQAPPEVLAVLEAEVPVRTLKLTEEGEKADATLAFSAVGFAIGFVIYFAVFIYGNMVMLAVIEEKASRVVEIVVSSVRPFQLLMGKVLGIGSVGLLQMAVWGVIVGGLSLFAGSILALFINPADVGLAAGASQQAMLEEAGVILPDIPASLFVWFVLFFLGGYLLYASLFAAVGSAVEQQQDAQTLVLPISLPIIIAIFCLFFVIEQPNSTLSIVLSLIPLFSPILMMVRIAVTDVAFWQVALSYLLLLATFVGAVWVSSRIYRVGILMYGKKPSIRDLARWMTYQ